MTAVKSKGTRPEMLVRRMLHQMGYRFRLHCRELPGTPDIVLPRHGKIVEVRGCYWHRHRCKKGRVEAETNSEFWRQKRAINVARDGRNLLALRRLGWDVLVLWECQTRNLSGLEQRLAEFMGA